MTTAHILIGLCCNDPAGGVFLHRVFSIDVRGAADPLLDLGSGSVGGNSLRYVPGQIVLAGKAWRINSYTQYCGNLSWDAVGMTVDGAADFLVWLHRRRLFYVESGETSLFEAWKRHEPLDRERVRHLLDVVAGERPLSA